LQGNSVLSVLAKALNFQYPILRIVGCKCPGRRCAGRSMVPFSILSCGSSVAREWDAEQIAADIAAFQYPILRIVGCKSRC